MAFVRGLRLSALLIYLLREALSTKGVEVHWGHLLSGEALLCSPECDVIIHRPGSFSRWNGSVEPVMDFRFVEARAAVAVVSCKSFVGSVDGRYAIELQPYVENVLLFGECCEPAAKNVLKKQATGAGYAGFWSLYQWDRAAGTCEHDESEWEDFLVTVEGIIARQRHEGQQA